MWIPSTARAQQAIHNAIIRHNLQLWAEAAAAAGRDADARTLMFANGAQARLCPFSVCVAQGTHWMWNFVGPREDCTRLGSRRRHLLVGNGTALGAEGNDDAVYLELGDGPADKALLAFGKAAEALSTMFNVLEAPVNAAKPVAKSFEVWFWGGPGVGGRSMAQHGWGDAIAPVVVACRQNRPRHRKQNKQVFGSVFEKLYDAVIKPFKPVAAALGPAVSAAVSLLDNIKCPADVCFRACWWAPRWNCSKCKKCGTTCPVKDLCKVLDLVMKALSSVTDQIFKAIGGAIDVIFKPLLDVRFVLFCVFCFLFCAKLGFCVAGAEAASVTLGARAPHHTNTKLPVPRCRRSIAQHRHHTHTRVRAHNSHHPLTTKHTPKPTTTSNNLPMFTARQLPHQRRQPAVRLHPAARAAGAGALRKGGRARRARQPGKGGGSGRWASGASAIA